MWYVYYDIRWYAVMADVRSAIFLLLNTTTYHSAVRKLVVHWARIENAHIPV